MLIFGPVPSRRLGRSLGINHIPPYVCSYSCVYCQLGRVKKMQAARQQFYHTDILMREVEKKISKTVDANESIDYLAFVPDGEPTLDINLGKVIDRVQSFNIPIAVITNSSLIWKDDVQEDLCKADWVSLKIDTTRKSVWKRMNRPFHSLSFQKILDGLIVFSGKFKGHLVTETMLANGYNHDVNQIRETAEFIQNLSADTAYISVPTRPPAEKKIRPPSEKQLVQAYRLFCSQLKKVEYLTGYEGNTFALTGDAETDLLAITSVHPMRKDAVDAFLQKAGAKWSLVRRLMEENKMTETEYSNQIYYIKNLKQ